LTGHFYQIISEYWTITICHVYNGD